MSESEKPVDVNIAVEGSPINTNLLDTLREKKGLSIERYGSLDDILKNMEEELIRQIGGFVGKEIELELIEVVLFPGIEDTANEEEGPVLARINDHNEQLVSFISIESTVFRSILGVLLGGYSWQQSEQRQTDLSAAECKLFLRFVHQTGAALLNALNFNHANSAGLEVAGIDTKHLMAESDKTELVSITFEISIDGAIQQIKILTPLEVLEPGNLAASESDVASIKQREERVWKAKLQGRIDELSIPLRAQIVSMEMSLVDVAGFAPGDMLDVRFDLTNVMIIDGDENCTFLSDIELGKNSTQLRIARASKSKGV